MHSGITLGGCRARLVAPDDRARRHQPPERPDDAAGPRPVSTPCCGAVHAETGARRCEGTAVSRCPTSGRNPSPDIRTCPPAACPAMRQPVPSGPDSPTMDRQQIAARLQKRRRNQGASPGSSCGRSRRSPASRRRRRGRGPTPRSRRPGPIGPTLITMAMALNSWTTAWRQRPWTRRWMGPKKKAGTLKSRPKRSPAGSRRTPGSSGSPLPSRSDGTGVSRL